MVFYALSVMERLGVVGVMALVIGLTTYMVL